MKTLLKISMAVFALASYLSSWMFDAGHKTTSKILMIVSVICWSIFILLFFWPKKGKKQNISAPVIKGEKLKFGVIWDSELNPYCPVCKTMLTLSTKGLIYPIDPFRNRIPPPKPVPHCLKCDEARILYDDDGKAITLSEAKKRLSPQATPHESAIAAPKNQPEPIQPKPEQQPLKSSDAIRAESSRHESQPSMSEYTEDEIGGIFWRWKQGPNYEPYDLKPYCPECPPYLQTDMQTVSTSSGDMSGKTVLMLKCWTPKHLKVYKVTGHASRSPYESIENKIRARLKSGQWKIAVSRKRARDRS